MLFAFFVLSIVCLLASLIVRLYLNMSHRSNEAPSSHRPQFLPVWEAFRSSSLDLQPQSDWARQKIPPELQRVDNEEDVPEKLKEILAWSLQLDAARRSTMPGFSTLQQRIGVNALNSVRPDSAGDSKAESIRLPASPTPTGNGDTTYNATRDPHGNVAGNPPEPYTGRSEQFSEKRRTKPRNVSSNVFASTLDLFASFKGKTIKEAPAAANPPKAMEKSQSTVECTSCFEETPGSESSKLLCNHSYCKPCLKTLITTALENEASFPPKCCLTPVPLPTIMSTLDARHRNTFREKAAEFSIPPQERWYCPNSKCLKWIRPSKLPRIPAWNERCPHCGTKICNICHGLAHKSSLECPHDSGLQATINLAELEGWRRCVKCRTMVERTQGCRHMTCKCGAQFCYTCGKKWRTCSCTETDEVNRQAELRRRRGERENARDVEAAELARVIAQVEEMEQQIVRERRREEERRESERRRQEAELARLEAEQLREQEAMRAEEARLEQHLQRILRLSVEESCGRLEHAWNETRLSQMYSLDNRHMAAERHHIQSRDEAMIQQTRENERTFQRMESNIKKRMSDEQERHTLESANFTSEQQNLEDDMFLEIQLHLRGKQDRETRERRLQARFQEQRWERHQQLLAKHELETQTLRTHAKMERQGLELANNSKMYKIEHNSRTAMENLSRDVVADRAWFDFLNQRRQNMVAAHRRLMLEALEGGQEPVGLTEEVAMTVGPFIADVQPGREVKVSQYLEAMEGMERSAREPWKETLSPSPTRSASPTYSFVQLATTSQQLLENLEAAPTPGNPGSPPAATASELLLSNSAFAWMTGATPEDGSQANNAAGSRAPGLSRSRRVSRHERPHPRTPISPSMANKPRNLRTSSEAPSSSQDGPAPNLPTLSISTEPTTQAHSLTTHETQQARVLGGLVPVVARTEDRRRRLMSALTHKRQSSSTSSASSSDSLLTPSTPYSTPTSPFASVSPSPTSHRSSATSRSSGDSLFLHSLIGAATTTAATATRPATATGAVSPSLPSAPYCKIGGTSEEERLSKPNRSLFRTPLQANSKPQ
ncbi:hypothetical protein PV04_05202 [Phialophora macrospora]|uniref:RBR-type E3 ubiquitin transferase n=1 Tax=Phialophora macrospora TaxID=1851006 RepID=A0A0D2FRZ4_9EURO|nr:hypothetical protein PV04_05202 [Phialophora macrospora]